MEWLTGLALLPALVCGAMMGGMALMGVVGLRRKHDDPPEPEAQDAPRDREATSR
ncbi:MAG TPA: hypothetical protein VE575_03180 [Acidimicrobiales bacterium]|jgi:hypothetical protein|nr:hypothetical protein [Acidimicrobiales bacterium]